MRLLRRRFGFRHNSWWIALGFRTRKFIFEFRSRQFQRFRFDAPTLAEPVVKLCLRGLSVLPDPRMSILRLDGNRTHWLALLPLRVGVFIWSGTVASVSSVW